MSEDKLTTALIRTMRRALQDFGYQITDEEVREAAESILRGKPRDDIIRLWVGGWLDEAGLTEQEEG